MRKFILFGRNCCPSLLVFILGLIAVAALVSCGRLGQTSEQAQVARAFESWKGAMLAHKPDQAMIYIPHHVNDYLNELKAGSGGATNAAPSPSASVDLFLRTALEKKVPADLRPNLTMATLLQHILERNLFNPRDVRALSLGRIVINNNRASAEVYYDGTLTALHLPFLKEDSAWKIDVMSILPYAEVLMRVDRAIKGETVSEQVDQLVSKLPSL